MKIRDFALGAFIGGVATGVAVALTTPKNGEQLRGEIKKEAETLYEEGRNKFDATYEVASERAAETKESLDDALKTLNERVAELKEEARTTVEDLKGSSKVETESTVSDAIQVEEELETNIDAAKEQVVAELNELNEALNSAE